MKNSAHVSGTEAEAHNYLNIFSLMNNKKYRSLKRLCVCARALKNATKTVRLCEILLTSPFFHLSICAYVCEEKVRKSEEKVKRSAAVSLRCSRLPGNICLLL